MRYISEQYIEEGLKDIWKSFTDFIFRKKVGSKETIQTPDEFFKQMKKEDSFNIRFIKKDGRKREMTCTLNFDKIPKESLPKTNKSTKEIVKDLKQTGRINVYDLENKGWRTIYIDSIFYLKTDSGIEYKIEIKK